MNLPPEILGLICGLMSMETLKCVRLACKALEHATAPFMFDEVLISSTYSDIEIANDVTTRFARHIKTITLSSCHFPDYAEPTFANLIQSEPSGWGPDFVEDPEKHAFGTYCKARAEHIEIIRSGELLAQLCQILVRLPVVRKLALTDRGCGFKYKSNDFYSGELWQRPERCPRGSCTMTLGNHKRLHVRPESGYRNDDHNLWHLIMLALSIANPPITEIVSMSTQYNCLIPTGCFIMTPRQIQNVTMRFKILTKLRLSLSNQNTDQSEGHRSYADDRSVSRALSTAVNLQNLFIENDGDIRDRSDMWTFCSVILGGCRFPKLRSLILVYIDAEEEELLNFLGASPRLENLFLCRFALSTGSWASVAARLKGVLQLKRVELASLSGQCLRTPAYDFDVPVTVDHRLVEDFFLRDGKNPFTQQAMIDFHNHEGKLWRINRNIGDYEKLFKMYH